MTHLTGALLVSCALALTGCSGDQPADDSSGAASAAVAPASESLPDALDDADGLQTVAEALKSTGIEGIFKDKGSYTLLAPDDDAFAALGDAGKQLVSGQDQAALAALLKAHMLTGYVTPQDIGAAIDASDSGQVTMATLAGGEVTFTRADGAIEVSSGDGSQARLEGDPVTGGQSIAIPVNGVLKKT